MNLSFAVLPISEAIAAIVGPVRTARVVGAAEAVEVCSQPGINVPAMIHDRHVIVHRFSVIVCRIVRISVEWCIIVVVIC